MSDLLGIGASGVRAYQSALSTTSENITNSTTAGYVRRTTSLGEVGAAAGVAGKSGTIVSGIKRTGDVFRDAEVRQTGADLARSEAGIVWLDRIDGALSSQNLSDRLGDFFNAGSALAADPSASAPRAVFLEQAKSVAQAFTQTGVQLDRAAADVDATGVSAAADLERYSGALGKVNAALGRAQPGSSGQAALLDERDRALDAIATITDITVTTDAFGRATVRGGTSSGPLLVSGDHAARIAYARSDEGAATFVTIFDGDQSVLIPGGGSAAGVIEGAQRIADARVSLGQLATGFAEGVNAVQAQGRDLAGNPGAPIFAVDATHPTTVSVVLADPAGIAAAGVGGGPRDNGNLQSLAQLRTDARFEAGATGLISSNAAALAARQTVADVQGAIHDQALAARSESSGVDLDREAVDLIRFQQAYQASTRIIQVARETLDTLFRIS